MKKRSILVLLVSGACFAGTVQNFDSAGTAYSTGNFAGVAGGLMSGGPTGDFYRITPQAGGTRNEIAFDATDFGAMLSATVDFDFRISGSADGMGVALIPTAVYGASGAPNIYVTEEVIVSGALGIGFDIYQNPENYDPSSNHLSVHNDGVFLNAYNVSNLTLANGLFNHARIGVVKTTGGSAVSVWLTPNGGSEFQVVNDLFVSGFDPSDTRLVFGARTGGASANQDIDNVSAVWVADPSAATPEPCTFLTAGGALALAARRRWRALH